MRGMMSTVSGGERLPDVITVVRCLHLLHLSDTGDVGQPHLDICLRENLRHRHERVEFCPEDTPARQRVSVIGQIELKKENLSSKFFVYKV